MSGKKINAVADSLADYIWPSDFGDVPEESLKRTVQEAEANIDAVIGEHSDYLVEGDAGLLRACGESVPAIIPDNAYVRLVPAPPKKLTKKQRKEAREAKLAALTPEERAKRDKESARARAFRLDHEFNLTPEEWAKIFEYQDGVCYICGRPGLTAPLNTDHAHDGPQAGLIRGLLCIHHNKALQYFEDNTAFLAQAIDYLNDPPAARALGGPRYTLPGRAGTKKRRKLRAKLIKEGKLEAIKIHGWKAVMEAA